MGLKCSASETILLGGYVYVLCPCPPGSHYASCLMLASIVLVMCAGQLVCSLLCCLCVLFRVLNFAFLCLRVSLLMLATQVELNY